MTPRFEAAVWSGVERRLAEVEGLIPDAPPWTRPEDAMARRGVRGGTAFGRPGGRAMTQRRRLVLALTVIAALLALVAAALLVGAPKVDRLDQPFGPFGIYRQADAGGSAVLLPDGRVLIASGTWEQMGEKVGSRIDLWDPIDGRVDAGALVVGRVGAAATLLLDGRVLITGGYGGPYAYASSAVADAEIWDPASGAFTATGSMAASRVNHTATALPDGRVLVVGGGSPDGPLTSAETWDPRTGAFGPAGTLVDLVGTHTATLLPNGDVLVLGQGIGEIWRATTQTFTPVPGVLSTGAATATPLLDGRLLVIHVTDPADPPAALIVTETGAATPAGTLLEPRTRYATTLLPDGRVLITGGAGSEQGPPMASVEVFDPADGSIRAADALALPVAGHQALLLLDGRVLIVFDVIALDGRAQPFVYDPRVSTTTE